MLGLPASTDIHKLITKKKMPKVGRSNIAGVSYLYLAEDVYTACAEIKPVYMQFTSVAEFVTQKTLKLMDFSEVKYKGEGNHKEVCLDAYFSVFREVFSRPRYSEDSSEYLIPQLFAEEVRKSGYDGICYRSLYSQKKNYTLFHFSDAFIKFEKSWPVFTRHMPLEIYDLNKNEVLPKPETSYSYENIGKFFTEQIEKKERNHG